MHSLRFVFVLLVSLLLSVPALAQVPPFAPASSTPPPFIGRYNFEATTFYGRAYFIGGGDVTQVLNDIWSSDDDGATWQNIPNNVIPPAFGYSLVTVQTPVNNTQLLLYLINNTTYFSDDGLNFFPSTNAYPARDFTATAVALPVRDQSGNPLLNGLPALFVLGGRLIVNGLGVSLLNDVYYSSGRGVFNYVLACANAPWQARWAHRAVAVEDATRIVIAGGLNTLNQNLNDVWISNVGGVTWTELQATAPWPTRSFFGLVNVAEKLSLFGGESNGTLYNDSQIDIHPT